MIDPTKLANREDRKVGQSNSSLYVTIPPAIAAALGIHKGDHVTIGERDGQAVIVPVHQRDEALATVARIDRLIAENQDAMDYLADR
ncbi:AbrB/MazE/SpoVT family DNA-binding domain-containing protein [Lacticaseibacillus suihuaensis]